MHGIRWRPPRTIFGRKQIINAAKNFTPMNERMEKILTRREQEHDVLEITIDPIVRPEVLSSSNPCIYVDGSYFFYTFDGRSLFFSREQSDPIISVPEETRDVCMASLDGTEYFFMLSMKNKLECLVNSPSAPERRYCITRNVLQVQKTNDKIYFIFKKDHLYFINECHFDGKKWIGKILHTSIQGKSVELFATDGSFFFINDGKLYNSRGDDMGIDADFVHKTGNLIVAGNKKRRGYMLRILDCTSMNEIDSLLIPTIERGTVRAHRDVVIQQIHSDLYVLRVTEEGFSVGGCIKYDQDVLCFDVKSRGERAFITLLVSEECDEQTFVVQGNQILPPGADSEYESDFSCDNVHCESNTSGLDPEAQSEWMHLGRTLKSGSSSLEDEEDGFFYDKGGGEKSSVASEMKYMSLGNTTSHQLVSKPKNKLLEEVRATLSKRRQSTNEQPDAPLASGPETDRFANYAKQETVGDKNIEQNSTCEIQPTVTLGNTHIKQAADIPRTGTACGDFDCSLIEKSPGDSSLSCGTTAGDALLAKTEIEKRPEHDLSPENVPRGLNLEQFLAEHRRTSLEIQRATISSVQSLLAKTGSVEAVIREVVVKTLVPSVEACFNEMRIQILTEIRKLVNNASDSSNPRINSIQRFIGAGKINQAIQEFMRLDEPDMNCSLSLFSCSSIENADSNILAQFLGKVFSLAKKQPRDAHFRLITACLLDIEVSDLTIENMQNMSVLLRYLKELDEFGNEKHNELNCLADIIIKKIKRRAKQGNAGKSV